MKEGHEVKTDPLAQIEKARVLQDSRCFDASSIDPKEVIPVMSKILYLINQGEELSQNESTEIFFRASKLYQSQHPHIRKMLYLLLKELSPKEGEVFMITSSLSRDVSTSDNPYYRASALRVMARILDPSLLIQMERFIKNSIVDNNDTVSSAAMIAGLKLCKSHPEVVRRWVTEVQEKLSSKNLNIHYHAMLLLFEMKKNDPLALSKFFEFMISSGFKNPLAQVQLLRFIRYSIKTIPFDKPALASIEKYLCDSLKRNQDMIVFEASKTLAEYALQLWENKNVSSGFSVLQLFLASGKNTTKFAGIKTINQYAIKCQNLLVGSLVDYEPLITESNRSLATLAISTLLKLSTEKNVDRLITQITQFMTEITDDFKIELIESLKILCLRMPRKIKTLLTFVGDILKGEGGFQLKSVVLDTLLQILQDLPSSHDLIMLILAEFIEDCHYEILQCKAIHLIGELGPQSEDPSQLIRFIYNRFILDKGQSRAAAVTALGKFAKVPELAQNVKVLLNRCLEDKDDEVRERARFYLDYLEKDEFPKTTLPVSIAQIEKAVKKCRDTGRTFTLELARHIQEEPEEYKGPSLPEKTQTNLYQGIAELEKLGKPLSSTNSVILTEKTAEYIVTMVAHNYPSCLLLQFSISNTLHNQALEDVVVNLHLESTLLEPLLSVDGGIEIYPCPRVDREGTGTAYALLRKLEGSRKGRVPTTLKFNVLEYEGDEVVARFEDEYQIESTQIELVS
ncbi:unnamed protein product [Blepharisma stoltei]|uniref:Coatomer subunit gamma n=1 Tax=Blepharisma stoltei TaxID=1481888 RepID=A0AAU9IND6_9CILI|nr:unnamed protein product [Blepharisma stoltei]